MVATYPGVANVFLLRGDAAGSIGLLERTRALCRPGEFEFYVRSANASLGYAHHLMGHTAESVPALEAAISDVSGGTVTYQATRLTWLGEAYLGLARLDDARTMANRAVEFAERHGHLGQLAYAHWLLGEVSLAEKPQRVDTVEAHFEHAVTLAEPRRMRPLIAHCQLGRGKLLAALDRRGSAREQVGAALAAYRATEMPYWVTRAAAQLAMSP